METPMTYEPISILRYVNHMFFSLLSWLSLTALDSAWFLRTMSKACPEHLCLDLTEPLWRPCPVLHEGDIDWGWSSTDDSGYEARMRQWDTRAFTPAAWTISQGWLRNWCRWVWAQWVGEWQCAARARISDLWQANFSGNNSTCRGWYKLN